MEREGKGEAKEQSFASTVVHLMEHQFTGYGCFWTKLGGCPALESSNILFDNLIKKHGGQLGVQQRTKFKGNLGMGKRQSETSRSCWIVPGQMQEHLFSAFSSPPPASSLEPLKNLT